MAEESTAGLEAIEGQPTAGTDIRSTMEGTVESEEQPNDVTVESTQEGTQEDTFFDPRNIQDKPELMSAYKQMQADYVKKTQAIKQNRTKIEAYDAFMADPVSQIQAMAKQYGIKIGQPEQPQSEENWEPKSWNDVLIRAKDMAKQELMQEMNPVIDQVKTMRKNSVESFLDQNAPDWRMYEDDMMANLKTHPTMANDPVKLYQISVPPEVLESRATQAALKKMQTKVDSAKVSGTSTTKQKTGVIPDKALTFDEAIEFARKELESKGIRPG